MHIARGYFRSRFQYNRILGWLPQAWESRSRVSPTVNIDACRCSSAWPCHLSVHYRCKRFEWDPCPRLAIGFVPLMLRDRPTILRQPSRFSRVTVNRSPRNWIRHGESICGTPFACIIYRRTVSCLLYFVNKLCKFLPWIIYTNCCICYWTIESI